MYIGILEYEIRQVPFAFAKTWDKNFTLFVHRAHFPGFPGLDFTRLEIHDFPGFWWPVQTLQPCRRLCYISEPKYKFCTIPFLLPQGAWQWFDCYPPCREKQTSNFVIQCALVSRHCPGLLTLEVLKTCFNLKQLWVVELKMNAKEMAWYEIITSILIVLITTLFILIELNEREEN